MRNNIKMFFAAIILSLTPVLVLSEQIETEIFADTITVQKGEVLLAKGNVLVRHGNNQIKAASLQFDKKSNEIKFEKLQNFYDGNSIKLSAEEATVRNDFSEGIIFAANLLIDDAIKIRTEEVRLKDGEIYSATGISRVTSCEECEGLEPNWYLSASSAIRDVENSNIIYKNVVARVKGCLLPISHTLGCPTQALIERKVS